MKCRKAVLRVVLFAALLFVLGAAPVWGDSVYVDYKNLYYSDGFVSGSIVTDTQLVTGQVQLFGMNGYSVGEIELFQEDPYTYDPFPGGWPTGGDWADGKYFYSFDLSVTSSVYDPLWIETAGIASAPLYNGVNLGAFDLVYYLEGYENDPLFEPTVRVYVKSPLWAREGYGYALYDDLDIAMEIPIYIDVLDEGPYVALSGLHFLDEFVSSPENEVWIVIETARDLFVTPFKAGMYKSLIPLELSESDYGTVDITLPQDKSWSAERQLLIVRDKQGEPMFAVFHTPEKMLPANFSYDVYASGRGYGQHEGELFALLKSNITLNPGQMRTVSFSTNELTSFGWELDGIETTTKPLTSQSFSLGNWSLPVDIIDEETIYIVENSADHVFFQYFYGEQQFDEYGYLYEVPVPAQGAVARMSTDLSSAFSLLLPWSELMQDVELRVLNRRVSDAYGNPVTVEFLNTYSGDYEPVHGQLQFKHVDSQDEIYLWIYDFPGYGMVVYGLSELYEGLYEVRHTLEPDFPIPVHSTVEHLYILSVEAMQDIAQSVGITYGGDHSITIADVVLAMNRQEADLWQDESLRKFHIRFLLSLIDLPSDIY